MPIFLIVLLITIISGLSLNFVVGLIFNQRRKNNDMISSRIRENCSKPLLGIVITPKEVIIPWRTIFTCDQFQMGRYIGLLCKDLYAQEDGFWLKVAEALYYRQQRARLLSGIRIKEPYAHSQIIKQLERIKKRNSKLLGETINSPDTYL